MLKNILFVIQILVATALTLSILLQAKGVGLSATFGGEGGFYRSRRGVEKLLLFFTIFISIAFAVTSLIGVIL